VIGGRHGIHVTAEQERRDVGRRPRKVRHEIADVAADLLSRVIHLHAGAHALENRDQALGDVAFALGHAGNPCQLEKFVAKTSLVHRKNRFSQSRLAPTACARCAGSVSRGSPPGITSKSHGSAACPSSCVPCSSETTSSASPCTTRWRGTPLGASA